jgi:hypothetical protein
LDCPDDASQNGRESDLTITTLDSDPFVPLTIPKTITATLSRTRAGGFYQAAHPEHPLAGGGPYAL